MSPAHKSVRPKKLKVVAPTLRKRRVLIHDDKGSRIMSARERDREPTWGQIQWVEKQASGFERVALLIEAADHQFERKGVDPEAAQHCAVAIGMLRDEFRALRARLWRGN